MRSLAFLVSFGALLSQAQAVNFINGEVVNTVSNIATFDQVVSNTNLSAYVEDGIRVTVPKVAFKEFDPGKGNAGSTFAGGFHYPAGGANGATRIRLTSGGKFNAIDMTAGDGWLNVPTVTYLKVWAFDGATLLYEDTHTVLAGSKIGLTHAAGMTDVYIGSSYDLAMTSALSTGSFQAFATDNVRIGEPVPEPATMAILGLGLAAAARRKRK